MQLHIQNPATGQPIKILECDDQNSVEKKFGLCKQVQKEWSQTTLQDRCWVIQKFATLLQYNKSLLAKITSLETGRPVKQVEGEISATDHRIKFFLDNVQQLTQPIPVPAPADPNTSEKLTYEPLGVIANISAWNYPYFVGTNVFIPALLTGNAVAYKPSEYASLTGVELARLFSEAGLPDHLFELFIGKGDVGSLLINQDVNGVFFTGSQATGVKIATQLAPRLIHLQLELGGKDPVYVCDDAPVSASAISLVDGAFYNAGQSCCSVERIYIHEKIYDNFVEEFLKATSELVMGEPTDESTYLGPLCRPQHGAFLKEQIEDAVHKGAKIVHGGDVKDTDKANVCFFEPTVLTDVNHQMRLMREESFGPVIGIQKVSSDEQALELMNDTDFGLTAGVFTTSKDRAESLLNKINSGSVYWNCCDRVSPYIPWTGRKQSGLGSTLGEAGIRTFVQPKSWHLRQS